MKHVTVNAEQAVVADTVVGGSKAPVEISDDEAWRQDRTRRRGGRSEV